MKVFLGGTCAESKWREAIIPRLKCDYFNPVVPDWTPECQEIEEMEKTICSHHLYVITPKMKGVFSIVEAVNDSKSLPKGCCIFCVTKEDDDRDFTEGEKRSLDATAKLIYENGGKVFDTLDEVVDYLNQFSYEAIVAERDLYKKKFEYVHSHWKRLVETILPENWYSELINDWWDGIRITTQECTCRLYRRGVQRRIKKNLYP